MCLAHALPARRIPRWDVQLPAPVRRMPPSPRPVGAPENSGGAGSTARSVRCPGSGRTGLSVSGAGAYATRTSRTYVRIELASTHDGPGWLRTGNLHRPGPCCVHSRPFGPVVASRRLTQISQSQRETAASAALTLRFHGSCGRQRRHIRRVNSGHCSTANQVPAGQEPFPWSTTVLVSQFLTQALSDLRHGSCPTRSPQPAYPPHQRAHTSAW